MQDMMQVGLRDSNYPCQGPFTQFAVANTLLKVGDKSLLDVTDGHDEVRLYFREK